MGERRRRPKRLIAFSYQLPACLRVRVLGAKDSPAQGEVAPGKVGRGHEVTELVPVPGQAGTTGHGVRMVVAEDALVPFQIPGVQLLGLVELSQFVQDVPQLMGGPQRRRMVGAVRLLLQGQVPAQHLQCS